MRRTAALLCAGALAAIGCSKDEAAPPGPAPGSAAPSMAVPPAPAPAPAPALSALPEAEAAIDPASADTLVKAGASRVELLDPGQEPRQKLRYPTEAEPEHRRVEIAITMTSEGEPVVVPPLALRLRLAIEGARLVLKVTAVDAPAEAAADIGGELLAGLSGVSGTAPFGPRGLGAPFEPAAEVPVEIRQLWSTAAEAAAAAVPPWPEAPIGVGARWRVYDRVRRGGIESLRRTELSLERLAPATELSATVVERVVGSNSRGDPAVPKDIVLRPLSGSGEGSVRLTRSADGIAAFELEHKTTTRARILAAPQLSGGAGPIARTVELEQRIRWARDTPPGR